MPVLAWNCVKTRGLSKMEQFYSAMLKDWLWAGTEFASIDVSFYFLSLIFACLAPCLADKGQAVAWLSPQFEAGREQIGKNGIIRDAKVHQTVLKLSLLVAVGTRFFSAWIDFHSPTKEWHETSNFANIWKGRGRATKLPWNRKSCRESA